MYEKALNCKAISTVAKSFRKIAFINGLLDRRCEALAAYRKVIEIVENNPELDLDLAELYNSAAHLYHKLGDKQNAGIYAIKGLSLLKSKKNQKDRHCIHEVEKFIKRLDE